MIPRTLLGLVLTGAFALAFAPSHLIRQGSPGRADDVAEVMPADAALFAEFVRAPEVLHDWKDFVGALCTKAGAPEVCKIIEDEVKKGLDQVPERLLTDLEKGLPSLQRLAVSLSPTETIGPEGPAWIVVATCGDAEFLKRLVDDDLKVFSFEDRKRHGVTVLGLRKLGEIRLEPPVWVAANGPRLFVTTNYASMCDAIDRSAGKGQGPDLRQHSLYAKLAPTPADAPSFRGFAVFPWRQMMQGPRSGMRRSGAHEMDKIDAVADLRKIQGVTVGAVLRPGRVECETRIHVDSPCRLLDVARQPEGPKDLLKRVPADAGLIVHGSIKGGAAVWRDIEAFMRRYAEVERRGPGRNQNRTVDEMMAALNEEMQREMGVTPQELAEAIGREGLLVLVDRDEVFQGDRGLLRNFVVAIEGTDAEKAAAVLEKIVPHAGAYAKKVDGDVTFWLPEGFEDDTQPKKEEKKEEKEGEEKKEGEEEEMPVPMARFVPPAMALQGRLFVMSGSMKAMRQVLAGGSSIELPPGSERATATVIASHGFLWRFMTMAFGPALPGIGEHLDLQRRAVLQAWADEKGVVYRSVDGGPAFLVQSSMLSLPLMFVAMEAAMSARMVEAVPFPVPEERPEPPQLPDEQLAARVQQLVVDLRSEELDVRDAAMNSLDALGKQAARHVAAAHKLETDAEARDRLMKLLIDWKAYDVMPEVLSRKVDQFIRELEEKAVPKDENSWPRGLVEWPDYGDESAGFPYALEPYYFNDGVLWSMQHRDVLDVDGALKAIVEKLKAAQLPVPTCRVVAQMLAYRDCSKVGDSLVEARMAAEDAEVRRYLQIAMGNLGSEGARETIRKGFTDSSRMIQRASFIAAEKSRDLALVPTLLELVRSTDFETSWNAAFTIGAISRGAAPINVYLPEAEFNAAVAAAERWYAARK